MNVVEIKAVSKHFRTAGSSVLAVDAVTLSVAAGEFFSLLGPSGCGKSTLLRLIAGFERADGGEIYLNGKPVGETPPYARPVNTVFQSYALFEHMSVYENVAFGLQMEKLPGREIKKRTEEALELVQLEKCADRRPHQLSGGQQQRVALARALAKRPAVLLLDEPLSALDLKLRVQMQQELKSLQRSLGMTFIFVTHDQLEALTMSDRLAVLNAGRILQTGTPAEIYDRPNCRFVAEFVGQTNLLAGTVEAVEAGRTSIFIPALGAALIAGASHRQPGEVVTVAIRPEKFTLHSEPGGAENSLRATVIGSTFQGAVTRYSLRITETCSVEALLQNEQARTDLGAGTEVWLSVQAQAVVLLPEEP